MKINQLIGETDLDRLIKDMTPHLNEGAYVFCTIDQASDIQLANALGQFREPEGTTIILAQELADAQNMQYSLVCSWITLQVHSSLSAVGLTAAFSQALAQAGISCNVVSGYFHDHIFVPRKDADRAMKALIDLSRSSK